MPYADYGLSGKFFLLTRGFQMVCLFILIGITSHLVSNTVQAAVQPTGPILAILTIVCLSFLYVVGSTILHIESLLPLIVVFVLDGAFTISLFILSIVIGKPLGSVDCALVGEWAASRDGAVDRTIMDSVVDASRSTLVTTSDPTPVPPSQTGVFGDPSSGNTTLATRALSAISGKLSIRAYDYINATQAQAPPYGSETYPFFLSGGTQHNCNVTKGAWGFTITLTLFFVTSSLSVGYMWWREKKNNSMSRLRDEKGQA